MDIHHARDVPDVRNAIVADLSGDAKDTWVAGMIMGRVGVRDLMRACEAAGGRGGGNG